VWLDIAVKGRKAKRNPGDATWDLIKDVILLVMGSQDSVLREMEPSY
jgi:hypothetical protein